MQIHITARHLNLTEGISNYLTKKVNRLERHFDHLVWANAIVGVEKHRHMAELIIHSPLHTLRSKAEAADLYAAIDEAVLRADVQLKKLKEKMRDSRRSAKVRAVGPAAVYYGSGAPADFDGGRSVGLGGSPWPSAVTVVKKVPVKATSTEEAIRMMDSLGYMFWMYLNSGTKRLNVVFRRADQSYGILEPAR